MEVNGTSESFLVQLSNHNKGEDLDKVRELHGNKEQLQIEQG